MLSAIGRIARRALSSGDATLALRLSPNGPRPRPADLELFLGGWPWQAAAAAVAEGVLAASAHGRSVLARRDPAGGTVLGRIGFIMSVAPGRPSTGTIALSRGPD